ncbi:PAS domain-containing protein [uncultured Sphingomonas sp.]|uniref:PAS domain-containing protein n=1 Tax=uncultured Sphingomonas sp. TaxID=158754 RepID=UPI0025889A8A|nr:PAS domain-containing protein [uncultured Sphingomonas sp.]
MTAADIDPSSPIWHDIADAMPVLAWIATDDGQLSWGNRRWQEDFPGAIGRNIWDCCHDGPGRVAVRRSWEHAVAGGTPFNLSLPLIAGHIDMPVRFGVRPDGAGRWIAIASGEESRRQAETARDATRAELDTLTNAMPQMIWATRPDGHHDYYNAQWYRFTGMPEGSTDGEGWNGMFHPEDQDRAWARWRRSLDTGEDYEIEYRLRHRSGAYRWVLGRALPVRDADGTIVRWIGTCTDIDSAKRAAEQNDILSRELSHRIKNIFAIISGLVRMSARRMPAVRDFADDLARRIAALGVAHDLARPHSDISRPLIGEATLHHVLRELLSPYAAEQWRIEGDDVPIDDRGATPVALIFHELATNAAKYGGLSVPEGRLAIRTRLQGDALRIDWCESGGPTIAGEPHATGFGTRLAALSIEQQLAGSIARDWRPEGLAVRIDLARSALVREPPVAIDA